MNLVRPIFGNRTSRRVNGGHQGCLGSTPAGELWAGRLRRSVLLPDAVTANPHIMAKGGEI